MQTQDLIEIQKDSTYTFTHFIESKNQPIIPSTANIIITNSGGISILTSTAMTIDGTTGVCTYAWDSTGQDVAMNYIVTYELDSYNPVVRLFDIMLYPFINNVTDYDLFNEYKGLKTNDYEDSSNAQSGTTTTIVDINRAEKDDTWNGGQVEIYQNQQVYTRTVADYVLSTNTVTFSPAVPDAVTTESYTIRQSYQNSINSAGSKVQLYFKTLEKRAYLVMDSYTLKQLIIYEVLKQYFFHLIKDDSDEYSIKYKHYVSMYQTQLESLKLVYDENADGVIQDDEVDATVGKVEWFR